MTLPELLQSIPAGRGLADVPNVEITGIEEDSRLVQPGHLFIAKPGTKTDGAQFLNDALAHGASAALVAHMVPSCPLPQVVVTDPAGIISPLVESFFNHPSRHIKVIGITGTNGKTTTTYLIRHILAKAGIRCGMVGTVEIDDGSHHVEACMTTPSPIALTKLLAAMRDNRCAACAIEVSSHALAQGRVAAIEFAAGAFTNLTGDHLDFHRTTENYAEAKSRLFQMLSPGAPAIVNARDPWSGRMLQSSPGRRVRFGVDLPAEYRATQVQVNAQGSSFTFHTPGETVPVNMRLMGLYNVENALTAMACVAEVFGLGAAQLADAMADATGAPGRLEPVLAGQSFTVLVDYAHTDDALKNVLCALRPLTTGKLRVLFGCGGDRDPSKRPRMARVAQGMADVLYVTSDNPRTEDPDAIIAAIVAGFDPTIDKPTHIVPDRRQAIGEILRDSQPGDIVLLAGKGHENYQIIGTSKHHFDDAEEARRALP